MRTLNQFEKNQVSAGSDQNYNSVEYGDDFVQGTVVVPASDHGQVVHLSVEVRENTLLSQWFS